MDFQEDNGIKYYLDDIAEGLASKYDPNKISGPHNLTGDYMEECAVLPFLLVARNTGTFWGFDFEGYQNVIDFFSDAARTEMAFAEARVKSEQDLVEIAERGHLRRVDNKGTSAYFVSESLAATAINPQRPSMQA